MDIKELTKERFEILSTLEQEYIKEMIPVQLLKKEENGADVLTVFLSGIAEDGLESIGEFFFHENEEDDQVQFFVNLITIAEELPDEHLNDLCIAIAAINAYIITGAFAIDFSNKSLIYKHTYEMPLPLDKEKLHDNLDLSMGVAYQMVRDYGYMLVEINEGRRSVQSVVNYFLQRD